jgi:hypothetical protein
MHHSNQKEFEGTTLARMTVILKNWNQALLMPTRALWGYFSESSLLLKPLGLGGASEPATTS